jgi:hypothetical protein
MVSGKQIDARYLATHDAPAETKEHLFRRIYRYNVEHGINTIEQLEEEGISCMPGVHPCNQVAAGLYLSYFATLNSSRGRACPGVEW